MSSSIISFVNPINYFEETMTETEYFSLSSNDLSDNNDEEIKYEYMESPSHYAIICKEYVDDDICTKVKKLEIAEPVADVINLSFLSQSPSMPTSPFHEPNGGTMTINDFEVLYEDNSCYISVNECLNYFEDPNDPDS
ncbi:hypothetical protein GIB67_010496 [Kingdonia uniflora]|uniref:Uncharacterized protein n=1 Tax=Kingdonia uniflora TaxID=39325 RepID=A0A7J7MAR2_9MAGN|nr:hypothetical protein GIB67_010496 [Kingdonia uniflora]